MQCFLTVPLFELFLEQSAEATGRREVAFTPGFRFRWFVRYPVVILPNDRTVGKSVVSPLDIVGPHDPDLVNGESGFVIPLEP